MALAVAAALAAFAGWDAPNPAPLFFLGGFGVVLLGLAVLLENGIAVAVGIAVLGCQFILSLYVRGEMASFGAALSGAALLLVSELAYWSLELGAAMRGERDVFQRRLVAIVALVAAALAVGLVAAAVAGAVLPGSVLLTALGAGSVLAVIALVTVLLWERRVEG